MKFLFSLFRNIMPYYAVRVGRKPGVYSTWDECRAQVDKFNKPRYKKFMTQEEAWDFTKEDGVADKPQLKGNTDNQLKSNTNETYQEYDIKLTQPKLSTSPVSQKTLLSLKGSMEQVKRSLDQARNFVSQGENILNTAVTGGKPSGKRSYSGQKGDERTKRLKSDCSSVESSDDSHDSSGLGRAIVYTDGACFNNGKNGSKAGIGVYWGHNHPRNLSESLTDGRQTNNRAEIYAATRAIQQAKEAGITDLVIRTDSKFLINCITDWVQKWKSNGWTSSSGKPVINKEELEELDSELPGINVTWEHVRGHVGIEGNEAADRLANEGAKQNHCGLFG